MVAVLEGGSEPAAQAQERRRGLQMGSRWIPQNLRIAQADINSIWEYTGPEPGADESALREAEHRLGFGLRMSIEVRVEL